MRELGIVEVRVATEDDTPVLILKEAEGPRHLAIWMTAAGAAGILAALEAPDVDHPSPHDLVVDLCELLGHRVKAVQLVGHQEGTFYAEVLVDEGRWGIVRERESIESLFAGETAEPRWT